MKYFLAIISICLSSTIKAQQAFQSLNTNWKFKASNTSQWYTAMVPGTIHTDLIQHKLIPNPFYRDNEKKVQWVSHTNWEYQTYFNVSTNNLKQKNIQIVFEGLDTYATVFLNGKKILTANNMFRIWRVAVKNLLQQKNNLLCIVFTNANKIADSLANQSILKYPCENNRNFIRKAQYHFGWDFAPNLTTCGIWRNVQLVFGNDNSTIQHNPPSWNVKLIQEKDSIGQSFYFTQNNRPIFIKGANWVPADVFLPRVSKIKYRNLLIAAKNAGINLLRVWGGGIYEDDYFYQLCDSLHIMVWQDFMFAGAMYPADEASLQNIQQEVIDNIKRLNHHPCIVLWCGNNEIDEAWNNWGWQKQFNLSNADSAILWKEYQKIFHQLLPTLVATYSNKPYIASTPLYGWGKQKSMTHGDSHYWGVWWGLEPIANYTQRIPRFMSEYGMQSFPNLSSILQFTIPADRDTNTAVMKIHQKHNTGFQNLATYIAQNNQHPNTFNQLIQATQTIQSKALQTAISAHFQAQPYCMGTILWQWNDCWPGITWSVIDYYGNKKLAYNTIKKLYKQKNTNVKILSKSFK